MRILAFETSSERGSIALLDLSGGSPVTVSRALEGGAAQSETALANVRQLLADSGVELSSMSAIAFGTGPGAFTSLRLGCGLAQGLALGSGLPLIAVSSLEALASPIAADHILVATDARMGEIYCAWFSRADSGLQRLGEIACLPPEHLSLPPGPQRWAAVGNAFGVYRARMAADVLAAIDIVDVEGVPLAGEIAAIAAARCAAAQWTPLAEAAPDYVRNKVALTTLERFERGGRA